MAPPSSFSSSVLSLARRLVLMFLGAVLAAPAAVAALRRIWKYGWARATQVRPRPFPPNTVNDPRWGEHRYVHVADLRMHYVEKGDRSRPLMVFLHGFPEFWFSWRFQLEHFSRNYWCVAPDLRGYGDTDKPTGISQYTLDKLAADVRNLVQALDREKCILVGHDWGGFVGYAVCHYYPDLVSAYVACNITHPAAAYEQLAFGSYSQMKKSSYVLMFQCPFLPDLLPRMNDLAFLDGAFGQIRNRVNVNSEDIEAYKFNFRDRGSLTGPLNYYRAVAQLSPAMSDFGRMPRVTVPVLSCFGTFDAYIDADTCRLSSKFVSDHTLELFDDVSHWSMMDDPDAVNRRVERYLKGRGLW